MTALLFQAKQLLTVHGGWRGLLALVLLLVGMA